MASVEPTTTQTASSSPATKPGEFRTVISPEIYDTVESIREGIAAEQRALPEFIILPEDFELAPGEITAVNLLSAVLPNDIFRDFYNRFPAVNPDVLVEVYTASKADLFEAVPEIKDAVLVEIQAVLPKTRRLPTGFSINKFLEEYAQKQEAIRLLLDQPPIENTGLNVDFNEFTAYFKETSDTFEWTTAADVFNRAAPTTSAPVVVLDGRWKILQGVQHYPTEIPDQVEQSVYIFIQISPVNFTIARLESGNENGVKIFVEAASYAAAVTPDMLIQRVGQVFGIPPENMLITPPETSSLKGTITFFGMQFNADVMADIILNDSVVNKWFYKNDLRKATREKSGLFVYFTPDPENDWPITITTGNLADVTESQRIRFGKTHTSGSYVTAAIKVKTRQQSEFLQQAIQGLLHRYRELSKEYSKNYKRFIPGWKEIPPVSRANLSEVQNQKYLKTAKERSALDPVLFPPLIVRKCPPEKQPWVVLDPEEIERIKREDEPDTYLEFPRPQEYPLFKRDFQQWIQPRLFTCKRKKGRGFAKEKYVSMVALPKPLPNPKDLDKILDLQVPVALCCETTSHRNNPKTVLNQWLSGRSSDFSKPMENTKGTTVFESLKIAPKNRKGVLPSGVVAILSTIFPKGNWYRYGVSSRENSAIEAVAMAKGMDTSSKSLQSYRNSREILPLVCSQENPTKTPETLTAEVRGDGYFSPRSYYRFLEELFGVRIILFIREGIKKTPGSLYGFQAFYGEYFFESNLPVVCLLEHGGAERDALAFPQTELIGHELGRTTTKIFTDEAAETLVNLRLKACRFVLWSRPNTQLTQVLPRIPNVSRQVIDQFGKCRGVEIRRRVFVEIPPSPPYNAPTMELSEISPFDRWRDLNDYNLVLKNAPVDGRNPAVLTVDNFSMDVTVITKPVSESVAEIFWKNKRLARVLQELFYISFAKWWESVGSVNISTELTFVGVQGFAENETEIDDGKEYPEINVRVNENGGFFKREKLILPSEDVRDRLLYMLWRDYQRTPGRILAMKNQNLITSLYVDRHDFRQIPGVSIVEAGMLENYQNISKPGVLSLNFVIDPEKQDPYFLLLDSRVLLARNFDDMDSAVSSGVGWETNGMMEAVPTVPVGIQWRYRLYVARKKYLVGPVNGRRVGGFEVLSYLYRKDGETVQGFTVVYW